MKFHRTSEIGLGLKHRAAFPHILSKMIEQWGEPLTDYSHCHYHYNFVNEHGQHFEIQMIKLPIKLSKKNLKNNCHCFYVYAKENADIQSFTNWIIEELQLLASLVVIKQQESNHVKQVGVGAQASAVSEAC